MGPLPEQIKVELDPTNWVLAGRRRPCGQLTYGYYYFHVFIIYVYVRNEVREVQVP